MFRRSLSTKVDGNGNAEILLRFNVTRDYRVRLKSGFFLSPARWKKDPFVIPRADPEEAARLRQMDKDLKDMEHFLIQLFEKTPLDKFTKDFINEQLELYKQPPVVEEVKEKELQFFEVFDTFIASRNLSE